MKAFRVVCPSGEHILIVPSVCLPFVLSSVSSTIVFSRVLYFVLFVHYDGCGALVGLVEHYGVIAAQLVKSLFLSMMKTMKI